jgi:hypothetical protein
MDSEDYLNAFPDIAGSDAVWAYGDPGKCYATLQSLPLSTPPLLTDMLDPDAAMITEAEASSFVSSLPAHTMASLEFLEHLLETELPMAELLDTFPADVPAPMGIASITHVPAVDVPAIDVASLLMSVTGDGPIAPVFAPVVEEIVWPNPLTTTFLSKHAPVAYVLLYNARDLFVERTFCVTGGPWLPNRQAYIPMASEALQEVIALQNSLTLDARVPVEPRK